MQPDLYQQLREVEDHHWWFRGRRAIVETLMSELGFRDGARILDLGCGTGGNLEMLSMFGEVTGVEMDEAATAIARERDVAPVMQGCLPNQVHVDEGSIDCVTMFDVLEHIPQDAVSLDSVNRLLKPGGYLVLTVPAFPFLWGPHDTAHHHQRRYRLNPLRDLLSGAGFDIRKISYYNTWLFPPAAAVRLVRKVIPGGDAGVEVTIPPGSVNRFLYRMFASERRVLKRMRLPFGISLLAIARKP